MRLSEIEDKEWMSSAKHPEDMTDSELRDWLKKPANKGPGSATWRKLIRQEMKKRGLSLKEAEVSERYGMRAGSTGQRQAQSDMVNMNKRANNKAQDQNREMMLRQKSANRRAGRLQTKIATGLPSRILNPQQPQAPEAQG